MSDELKPCPFCGSLNIEVLEEYETDVAHNGRLHCRQCGCEQAKPKWNARHTPEAVKGVVEALEMFADVDNWRLNGICDPNSASFCATDKARAALKDYKIHIGE